MKIILDNNSKGKEKHKYPKLMINDAGNCIVLVTHEIDCKWYGGMCLWIHEGYLKLHNSSLADEQKNDYEDPRYLRSSYKDYERSITLSND